MHEGLAVRPFQAALTLCAIAGAAPFWGATAAHAQTTLTGAQIQTLLVGKYACGSSGGDSWNETLAGGPSGTVTDYKKGPTDPVDPSVQVGTYAINSGSSPNTITYDYGGGTVYTYRIDDPSGSTYPNPGSYSFVGLGGGAPTLTITVSAGHC